MAIGQVTLLTNVSPLNRNRKRTKALDESNWQLTLIVARLGSSMIEAYVVTSRFISVLIQMSVSILSFAFMYAPYAILSWLVVLSAQRLLGYVRFFRSFFLSNQIEIFWGSVGYYIVAIYLLAVIVFIRIQRKKALRVKSYYSIAILLLALYLSRFVFDLSTVSYRDKPTIWITRPEKTAESWADITIIGRNFGEKPFSGKVLIDGIEQRVINWREKEIVFRTNPIITQSGSLSIETRKRERSNSIMFYYTGKDKE